MMAPLRAETNQNIHPRTRSVKPGKSAVHGCSARAVSSAVLWPYKGFTFLGKSRVLCLAPYYGLIKALLSSAILCLAPYYGLIKALLSSAVLCLAPYYGLIKALFSVAYAWLGSRCNVRASSAAFACPLWQVHSGHPLTGHRATAPLLSVGE